MKNRYSILIALLLIITGNNALADTNAITLDGKTVLLKDDHTWEYSETESHDKRYAHLFVTNIQGGNNYCQLGLTLRNNLADYITSIVFKFSVHNHEDVLYNTVTKGFQHLKPTNEGFREIIFKGIGCDDIKYIRVHGADRCEIGELTKFSADKGVCLEMIKVEPSDKVVIFKRYLDDPEAMDTDEDNSMDESMIKTQDEVLEFELDDI